ARFFSLQAQLTDYVRICPAMTDQDKTEAGVELDMARTEALKSYNSCRDLVRFDGAVFQSATRSTPDGEIVNLRFHGCQPTLSFPKMRVLFTRNGMRGNIYVQNVIDLNGRWVHRSGVSICEQSVPQ